MSKIFISYRRRGGSTLGQLLYYRLKEDGHEAFFDTESMVAGRFDQQIIDQIDSSDVFLSLLTPNSLDRCCEEGDFVRLEIARAIQKDKKIIPVMALDFEFPEVLPEDINDIRFYQGVKENLEFPEAFYQKILGYIENGDLSSSGLSYDIYDELKKNFDTQFGKKEQDENGNREQSKPEIKKSITEAHHEPAEQEDDYPEDDLPHRSFAVLDSPDTTTMCFQIKSELNKNSPGACLHYLILLEPQLEQATSRLRRIFYPVFYSGRAKDTRVSILFLTIKDKDNKVMINGGEFFNGRLTVSKKPCAIKCSKFSTEMPDQWAQDALLDMTEYEDSSKQLIKEFTSPFSQEKLQYLIVDPETKTVIRPKLVRSNDGNLLLKLIVKAHHSYVALQVG